MKIIYISKFYSEMIKQIDCSYAKEKIAFITCLTIVGYMKMSTTFPRVCSAEKIETRLDKISSSPFPCWHSKY